MSERPLTARAYQTRAASKRPSTASAKDDAKPDKPAVSSSSSSKRPRRARRTTGAARLRKDPQAKKTKSPSEDRPLDSTDVLEFVAERQWESAERGSWVTNIIANQDVSLQNRDMSLNVLRKVVGHEVSKRGTGDKRQHNMALISALSGLGKTRLLLETRGLFSPARRDGFVYMTYNSTCPEIGMEQQYDAADVMSWRLIYFHFVVSTISWSTFFAAVLEAGLIMDLSLETTVDMISADIRQNCDPKLLTVLIIGIDEFQELTEARLLRIVSALAAVMTRQGSNIVIVPVFAGLRSKDLMVSARKSKVGTVWIPMPPLSFKQAVTVVRQLVPPCELREPTVRAGVFTYGSIPAQLIQLCLSYTSSGNWADAVYQCKLSWNESVDAAVSELGAERFALMVAYAITGEIVDKNKLSLDELERCGSCVFVNAAKEIITVPVAVLALFASTAQEHDHARNEPFDSAIDGLRDSIKWLFSILDISWGTLETLGAAYHAMRINAYKIIKIEKHPEITVAQLLPGAIMHPSIASIRLPITPTCVLHPKEKLSSNTFKLKVGVSPNRCADWMSGNFVVLCAPDQEAIDVFCLFRDACDETTVFDLFIFDQRKLVRNGGLQKQEFLDRKGFCDGIVKTYTSLTGRAARFILGIVDPVKMMSTHCSNFIKDQEDMPAYGIGRDELGVGLGNGYFGIIAGHPTLLPHIFINSRDTSADDLALVLEGANKSDIAARLIQQRPTAGYSSWSDVTAVVSSAQLAEEYIHCIMYD